MKIMIFAVEQNYQVWKFESSEESAVVHKAYYRLPGKGRISHLNKKGKYILYDICTYFKSNDLHSQPETHLINNDDTKKKKNKHSEFEAA